MVVQITLQTALFTRKRKSKGQPKNGSGDQAMKLSNTKLLDLNCQQGEYTNASLMPSIEEAPKPLKVQMHHTRK